MPFQPLNTSNSLESNFSQVNGLMTDFKNQQQVNIFKDDTGTPVVILNKDGLKTTAPGGGIDVTTATDSQFTFNSAQDTFKIVKKVSVTASASPPGGSGAVTYTDVPHSLGFVPAVIAFLGTSTTSYQPLPFMTGSTVGASSITIAGYVDIVNIDTAKAQVRIQAVGSGGAVSYPITVYFLRETAN